MLNRRVLERLRDRARQDVDAGLQFGGVEGCTLAIGYQNELLWEEGFGAAQADTPILMLSITKTVLESAMWHLFADGLDPETPVVDVIPEFMNGTQPDISIAMIETHLAGFARLPMSDAAGDDRSTRLDAFRAWRLPTPPGFYEYNPINGGWILAEIIDRVTRTEYRTYLKEKVLAPLGLANVQHICLGVIPGDFTKVLLHRNHMNGYTPDPTRREPVACGLDTPAGLAAGVPAVGAVGTAAGVAKLYQAYLHNPDELWDPAMLADARDQVRVAIPDPAGRPMLRSLSFVQAGDSAERYGERTFFGPSTSERAFGHQGQGGQIAWADPATGLSFAYLTNTVVFPPGGCFHPRSRELSDLAARVMDR